MVSRDKTPAPEVEVPFVSEGMRSELDATGQVRDPSTGRIVVKGDDGTYRFA